MGRPFFFSLGRACVACTVAVALLGISASHADEAPRLRDLIARANVVAAGDVGAVTAYANGRVSVAPLHVSRVLKGEDKTATGASLQVMEMRDLPIPPLLDANTRVLAFLAPARKMSFLRDTLPAGEYLSPVGKPPGWLVAESPAELDQLSDIVARLVKTSRQREADPAKRNAATRTLVFDLIAAHNVLVVEDGAVSLDEITELKTTLTADEQARLATALARTDLPPRVQVALIRGIAASGLTQLAPNLQAVSSPEGQAAAWQALDKLGQPLGKKQLEEKLHSGDSAARTNAVRELLNRDGGSATDLVAPIALHDPDPAVRSAAIRALGNTKSPEALVPLERAFQDAGPEERQTVGRAIRDVGGQSAAESFARLAWEGSPSSQRYATLLLLLLGTSKDDPLVQKIATQHPDQAVRDLVEKGLPPLGH